MAVLMRCSSGLLIYVTGQIKFRLIRNLFMLSMRIWMHAGSLESTKDV